MLQGARVTVTGGAGFIGSNLVEKLLESGAEVTVLDNFSTGKMKNLQPFTGGRHFRLIVGDVRNMEDCRRAVSGCDYVLHEAALGSVSRSVKDPMTSAAVNILGYVNMLYAAQEAGVKRFIYAASSAVYGDSRTLPKAEDQIGKPLSPYAVTKYADEIYAGNFHDLYGIDTVGLRYFNVFGRRQGPFGEYAAVIPKFVMKLMRHERPVINGDGGNSRDFTYIDNAVQANILALSVEKAEALNQVYNIACGARTTLNELFAYLKADLSGYDAEIAGITPLYGPPRPGDIPHSLACIDKARKLLGYKPEFSVEAGLRAAAEWYFSHLRFL